MAKGWKASDESKARMSAARKGRKHSEETKAKMRAARLAYNPMKGRQHTEETRAKMRAAHNPQHERGENAVNWRGGRTVDSRGYVLIYMPEHPDAVGNYIPEHRWVAEQTIGRRIRQSEAVHHLNEIHDDNRPENLQVMPKSEHTRLHRLQEVAAGTWHRGSRGQGTKLH